MSGGALLAGLAVLAAGCAPGATVHGKVATETGHAIPEAEVRIQAGGAAGRVVRTNADGVYVASYPREAEGTPELAVARSGFEPVVVELQTAASYRCDVMLKPAPRPSPPARRLRWPQTCTRTD